MIELLILTTLLILATHGASRLAKRRPNRWHSVEKLLCLACAVALAATFWAASAKFVQEGAGLLAGAAALGFLVIYPLMLIWLLPGPSRWEGPPETQSQKSPSAHGK